jgi:hypothetical protein
VFPQRSKVSALSTVPGGISLYVLDSNGKVWTNFFPASNGSLSWNGWFDLPGDNVFPQGSTVTALSTVPGGTSLYVVGFDDKVWTNFFPAADGSLKWNGWFALGHNVFPKGAKVAALNAGSGATGLYALSSDGKVWTNFFPGSDDPREWEGWWPVAFLPYVTWLPAPPQLQSTPFSRANPLRVS